MGVNRRALWDSIEACLDNRHPTWRQRIDEMGQVAAVEARSAGQIWSDNEVFKALLLAVLSSNTVWSRIEGIQDQLKRLFCDFSLDAYAKLLEDEVGARLVPWFESKSAGSQSLKANLARLIDAARILVKHRGIHGTAENYFTSLMECCVGDAKQAALCLGQADSRYKLPALGVPVAAETLKNLGYDVAKPDRHIMQALGSFGLVQFKGWEPAQRKRPKTISRKKLLEVMTVAEQIADKAERSVTFVDNAIWLLCAKDELYLGNSELAKIAQ